MEFTKELKYNHQNVRHKSVFTKTSRLMYILSAAAAPLLIALAAFVLLIKGEVSAADIGIFCAAAVIFTAVFIFSLAYLLFRRQYKTDIIIDDQSVYVRSGAGYFKFDKYEIGTVMVMPGVCEQGVAAGTGDKNFIVESGHLIFYRGAKKVSVRVKDAGSLAYVLYNIALFPESAANWGVAYLSRN